MVSSIATYVELLEGKSSIFLDPNWSPKERSSKVLDVFQRTPVRLDHQAFSRFVLATRRSGRWLPLGPRVVGRVRIFTDFSEDFHGFFRGFSWIFWWRDSDKLIWSSTHVIFGSGHEAIQSWIEATRLVGALKHLFPYIGNTHPNWQTHIFQGGRYTNHQPDD